MERRRRAWLLGGGALVLVAVVVLLLRPWQRDEPVAGAPAQVDVEVARVVQAEIRRTVEAVGTLQAARSVVVTAEEAGRVAEVLFRNGQRVAAGEPLLRLDRERQAADVAALRAEAAELRERLARQEALLPSGAIARSAVDELRRQLQAAEARAAAARTRLRDAVVRAPFDGTIGLSRIAVGAYVVPGDAIAPLDDAATVVIRATLPERELGRVGPGAPLEARTPAFPEQVFPGEVVALDSRLDPDLRVLAFEAELPNPEGRLRPGMLVNVRIEAETVPEAVLVPALAVQVQGGTHFVYRIDAPGCARRVEVEIGERDPGHVEVLRGLAAGQLVAVAGLQRLAGDVPVRVVAGPAPPPAEVRPVSTRESPSDAPRVDTTDVSAAGPASAPPATAPAGGATAAPGAAEPGVRCTPGERAQPA